VTVTVVSSKLAGTPPRTVRDPDVVPTVSTPVTASIVDPSDGPWIENVDAALSPSPSTLTVVVLGVGAVPPVGAGVEAGTEAGAARQRRNTVGPA